MSSAFIPNCLFNSRDQVQNLRLDTSKNIANLPQKNHLTPNNCLKSASLNRKGIFETCNRLGPEPPGDVGAACV